jgi:hypothetical protein
MGLLDDAIREHLELKRRRGADPAEVARAEQEALGPVRREPEAAAVAQETVHHEAHEPLANGHDHDDVAAYPEHDEPGAAPAAPDSHVLPPEEQTRIILPDERAPGQDPAPAAEQPQPPARDAGAQQPPPDHDEPVAHEQPAAETASPPHGDPAHDEPVDPRESDIVHQPTTEWRIEDEEEPFAPEPGATEEQNSDEDLLEETPDFLQETPEHDRLWFEQRPPRDFDFDD